jgi:hypothetical protein
LSMVIRFAIVSCILNEAGGLSIRATVPSCVSNPLNYDLRTAALREGPAAAGGRQGVAGFVVKKNALDLTIVREPCGRRQCYRLLGRSDGRRGQALA